MTMAEIVRSDKDMLTPADVAEVLGVHPSYISQKAKEGTLEFASFRSGNSTKSPRKAFLHWMEFGNVPVILETGDEYPKIV